MNYKRAAVRLIAEHKHKHFTAHAQTLVHKCILIELSDIQKLKRLRMTNNGFYGDTFSDGFGVFQTMKKRGFQVPCVKSHSYSLFF